jgi:hypothetical protein
MARKGWDTLSDGYRRRLERGGVSRTAYESGSTLAKARGHKSSGVEAFKRRTATFSRNFASPNGASEQRQRILSLGPSKGQQYMDYRRKMTRLYEAGKGSEASAMYQKRDKSIPDSHWWYHGLFGG